MIRYALALVALLTAGCTNVLSLSPAVTAASAVTDNRLPGLWIADDTSANRLQVSIRPADGRSYQLDFVEGRDSSSAIGRLMPAGKRWLLNLSPTPAAARAIDRDNGIVAHMQVVLETSDSVIRVSLFDADTLKALAGRREPSIPGVAFPPGGDVLLTDTTARLGPALAEYLSRPGATRTWLTFRRVKAYGVRPILPRDAGAMHASSCVMAGCAWPARHTPPLALVATGGDPVKKGILHGMWIGAVAGAIIGATVADPDPRTMFSGREYGALGGGLAGAIAGAIIGGITGAVRQ